MGSSTFEDADGGGHFVDGGIDLEWLARAVTNLARSTTDTESIYLLLSSTRLNQEEGRERRKSNDEFQTLTRKRHSEDQRAEMDDGNKRARRTVDKNVKSAKGKAGEIEEFESENCQRSFRSDTALKTHKNSCAGEAHIVDLPTSQTPSKRKGAASNSTPDKLNSKYDKGKTRFPCKQCKRDYSTKGNLARHVKLTHLGKKPEEVVATKVVLNTNKNENNTTKAEPKREPKCEKSKCVFCDKELSAIYRHYGNIHNIEYPEQLLFFNSNVLVISDIDTKGGKAPWFLRESEKAKRYTPTTCRLCETEYDDPAVLENHYRSDHKVVSGALERLQHLFRAKKGAHLADLPASRAPSKLQKSTLRPPQGEPLSGGLVTDTNGYVSAAEERPSPGKEHEKSSDVVQVNVHEQNSGTNSLAIHQAQELEERDAFSQGLQQDLKRSLKILLGDGENYTCVNESTSDNSYTSTQLRDILETNSTGQETSEMDNDREQVHAVIQNNNDELVVHSRNDTVVNISQDIFTSEPSEIRRENCKICELSQDMFSGTTQIQEHIDIADNTDDANETVSESDQGYDGHTQPNPRLATRDIIRLLLEDTTSGFNADTEEERRNEEKRKIDQQRLIDETQRIRDIMFSRD